VAAASYLRSVAGGSRRHRPLCGRPATSLHRHRRFGLDRDVTGGSATHNITGDASGNNPNGGANGARQAAARCDTMAGGAGGNTISMRSVRGDIRLRFASQGPTRSNASVSQPAPGMEIENLTASVATGLTLPATVQQRHHRQRRCRYRTVAAATSLRRYHRRRQRHLRRRLGHRHPRSVGDHGLRNVNLKPGLTSAAMALTC
jgi:hypothetical protein